MIRGASLLGLMLAVSSCRPEVEPRPVGTKPTVARPKTAAPNASPAPSPQGLTVQGVGLATPESVLYDHRADRYLVSNINGSPTDADDNGFISEIDPTTGAVNLKWIDGGRKEVDLSAPKGMALVGDLLYVTDLTVLRTFDGKTGKPESSMVVEGATFLNDVSAGPDESVFVSDSDAETGAIYQVDREGKITRLAAGPELGGPNGLAWVGEKLWVVSYGSGEIYRLSEAGQKVAAVELDKGGLDGLVDLGDGTVLISSWEGQAVYRGVPAGPFEAVVQGLDAPADIGWDPKRSRVLVPLFKSNAVEARRLVVAELR